jgi:hypothetical protein
MIIKKESLLNIVALARKNEADRIEENKKRKQNQIKQIIMRVTEIMLVEVDQKLIKAAEAGHDNLNMRFDPRKFGKDGETNLISLCNDLSVTPQYIITEALEAVQAELNKAGYESKVVKTGGLNTLRDLTIIFKD